MGLHIRVLPEDARVPAAYYQMQGCSPHVRPEKMVLPRSVLLGTRQAAVGLRTGFLPGDKRVRTADDHLWARRSPDVRAECTALPWAVVAGIRQAAVGLGSSDLLADAVYNHTCSPHMPSQCMRQAAVGLGSRDLLADACVPAADNHTWARRSPDVPSECTALPQASGVGMRQAGPLQVDNPWLACPPTAVVLSRALVVGTRERKLRQAALDSP